MIIHRDCFVSLTYRLQLNSGEYIRGSSRQPETLTFVAGYKELLPALENQLLGLKPGDESQFVIPATEAFGLRDPWLVQECKRNGSQPMPSCVQGWQWFLTHAPSRWNILIKSWK